MHCRYCSVIYQNGATRCDGCGAPKVSIGQRVFDAAADKESYPVDFRKVLSRIALFHGVVLVVAFTTTIFGSGTLDGLLGFLAILWMVPVSPAVLGTAAWASGRNNFPVLFVNLILVVGVWFVFIVTFVITVLVAQ